MKAKTEAYIKQQQNGNIKSVKEAILDALKYAYYTKNDLKIILNKSHSTITARLSDLHDEGKVKEVCNIKKDGSVLTLYRLSKTSEVDKIKKQRETEKIKRSIKYLESKGYEINKAISK